MLAEKAAARTPAEKQSIAEATLSLLSKFDLPASQRPAMPAAPDSNATHHRTFRNLLAKQEQEQEQTQHQNLSRAMRLATPGY